MKKILNTFICTTIFLSLSLLSSYAQTPTEINSTNYIKSLSEYIKDDSFCKIKETSFINLKAIKNGMNIGYIKPRVNQLNKSKKNIDNFIVFLESVQVYSTDIQTLSNDMLVRLKDMSLDLEHSLKEHKKVMNYTDSYLDKVISLKINNLLSENGSSNSSLNRYNDNLKSVNKIYKDIKKLSKITKQSLSVTNLI